MTNGEKRTDQPIVAAPYRLVPVSMEDPIGEAEYGSNLYDRWGGRKWEIYVAGTHVGTMWDTKPSDYHVGRWEITSRADGGIGCRHFSSPSAQAAIDELGMWLAVIFTPGL